MREGRKRGRDRAGSPLSFGRTQLPFQVDSQSPRAVSSETWLKEASICAVSSIQRRANGPSKINMQTCTLSSLKTHSSNSLCWPEGAADVK